MFTKEYELENGVKVKAGWDNEHLVEIDPPDVTWIGGERVRKFEDIYKVSFFRDAGKDTLGRLLASWGRLQNISWATMAIWLKWYGEMFMNVQLRISDRSLSNIVSRGDRSPATVDVIASATGIQLNGY